MGGKLLGGALSLCASMAVAFLFALLILSFNPDVAFSGAEWVRLALLLGVSCLFLVQVFAMSLAVSAFVRSSATSLMLCLFGWLTLNLGYGNVLPSLSRYGVQEHTFQDFLNQNRQVRERGRPGDPRVGGEEPASARGLPARHQHRRPQPLRASARLRVAAAPQCPRPGAAPGRLAPDQPVPAGQLRAPGARGDPGRRLVDPLALHQLPGPHQAAGRTTLAHKFQLREAGYRYRTTFIDFLRGREAFSSRRWFTDDPPEQEPLLPDPEALTPEDLAADSPFMKERMAWVKQQEAIAARQGRRLDLSDLPAFDPGWREPISATLRHMTPGLLVMVLVTAAAVMLAVLRFLRYDPS